MYQLLLLVAYRALREVEKMVKYKIQCLDFVQQIEWCENKSSNNEGHS